MRANHVPVQRSLRGKFRLNPLSKDRWRVDNLAPPGESLWLRGIDALAAPAARHFDRLTVVWQADGRVGLTLGSGAETVTAGASSALLHEPREQLYDSLPLPQYTAQIARFWRRVFRLVRIPGGRLLVGLLARRSRRGT